MRKKSDSFGKENDLSRKTFFRERNSKRKGMVMNGIIGQRIKNKKQEEGYIVDFVKKGDSKYVFVRFDYMDESDKEKQFVYPDAINKYLFVMDESFDIKSFEKDIEKSEIERFLRERSIKLLFHVTRIENLESILEKGIIPRDALPENAISNDIYRYDKKTDCNCLSVGRPNNKYFSRYIHNTEEPTAFVCLCISPNLLLDENIKYYCHHNAATSSISDDLAKEKLCTSEDFKHMFDERVEAWSPIKGDIIIARRPGDPPYCTTSIQAEILYKGVIGPESIVGVDFPDKQSCENSFEILRRYKKRGTVRKYINF